MGKSPDAKAGHNSSRIGSAGAIPGGCGVVATATSDSPTLTSSSARTPVRTARPPLCHTGAIPSVMNGSAGPRWRDPYDQPPSQVRVAGRHQDVVDRNAGRDQTRSSCRAVSSEQPQPDGRDNQHRSERQEPAVRAEQELDGDSWIGPPHAENSRVHTFVAGSLARVAEVEGRAERCGVIGEQRKRGDSQAAAHRQGGAAPLAERAGARAREQRNHRARHRCGKLGHDGPSGREPGPEAESTSLRTRVAQPNRAEQCRGETPGGQRVTVQQRGVCPERRAETAGDRGDAARPITVAKALRQQKDADGRDGRRHARRGHRRDVGEEHDLPRCVHVLPECAQHETDRGDRRHGHQAGPRGLVGIDVSAQERLVARVVLVGIDPKRVALDDGTHEVEARVLVPAPTLVEEGIGPQEHDPQEDGARPGQCGSYHQMQWIMSRGWPWRPGPTIAFGVSPDALSDLPYGWWGFPGVVGSGYAAGQSRSSPGRDSASPTSGRTSLCASAKVINLGVRA